jgi:glyoxylase-like metal-dependent hydrolase (beta-lactamase superfamily II)
MFRLKAFTFNPLQENTYLLYNEQKDAILIDPGCYEEHERTELSDFIQNHDLQLKYLLNTHCHLDHVFGNLWIYTTYQTPLHIHENEKKVLEAAPVSGLMWGLSFDNYQGPIVTLKEGEKIHIGHDCLEVLFTPGHSPGHISFYCKEQDFILSGDVLFRESIGRTDLPGGNHDTLLHTIRTQLFQLPEETNVYSGHGPGTTIGHEKKYNPFLINE